MPIRTEPHSPAEREKLHTHRRDVDVDVAVIGGGLAGVAAAISASREGARVALIQNRPVLGGNSSSEVRVWVCGATATGHQRFARETGIIGELYLENEYRNPLGNPHLWDLLLLDTVKAEPNIQLLLNTHVSEVEREGPRIRAVYGEVLGAETEVRVQARMFIDASGDGTLAAAAGADILLGRESAQQFGETSAPDSADDLTLGSTLLFYTRDEGEPVPFVAPAFAIDIDQTPILRNRILRTGDNGADYWWIEWGGEIDVVADNERIRDELWGVIYGIWDHIKNSGEFPDAANLTLEWVGSIPGKREYRRVKGHTVMTQADIVEDVSKIDAIGFGGWSIDLHPPRGVYEPAPAARQTYPPGTYDIPFGVLYSPDIPNLLFAGRNVSATHVAFGSLRVMATCAVMGEAAGTAAAMCVEADLSPREVHVGRIDELQQRLIRADASMIGVREQSTDNRARDAVVTASSSLHWEDLPDPEEALALTSTLAMLVPAGQTGVAELFLSATEPTTLNYSIRTSETDRTYFPAEVLHSGSIDVASSAGAWVPLEVSADELVSDGRPWIVVLEPNPVLSWWHSADVVSGMIAMNLREDVSAESIDHHISDEDANEVVRWGIKAFNRRRFGVRFRGPISGYEPSQASSGLSRPFAGPNMWSSATLADAPEWVQLSWDAPVKAAEIRLVLNDDVNEYMNNLHYVRKPFRVIPELLADIDIEVRVDGQWSSVAKIRENRRRHVIVPIEPKMVDAVRIVALRTNGARRAQMCEVRVYEEQHAADA
ncbi:FAD-dependent oxidoreductase [Microbacterium keratanolyticum]|uniref:FAD-dependent oxidoreductase n=2 Tax=Microbacterium keratanolyticum TaxID=67574 RepID=UPI00366FF2E0